MVLLCHGNNQLRCKGKAVDAFKVFLLLSVDFSSPNGQFILTLAQLFSKLILSSVYSWIV